MIGRTLRRGWDIYVAFLLLTLACAIMVYLAGGGRLPTRPIRAFLLDHPGATLAQATILQYRPVNTDVLPVFVLLHLLFAPLLWLLLRVPNATLGASLALYVLVQPSAGPSRRGRTATGLFNPLAWQLLVVLGAWWMIEGQERPAVGDVAHGACACRPVSALQPGHRIELAYQTAGSIDPAGAGGSAPPVGQIESRSVATAAFFGR